MTTIDWPTNLPWFAERDGADRQLETNRIDSDNEVGPPKSRRRVSMVNNIETFSLFVKTAQLSKDFETFYRDTLKDGVLSFRNTDPFYPEDTTIYKWKFVGDLQPIVPVAGTTYRITLTLRQSAL